MLTTGIDHLLGDVGDAIRSAVAGRRGRGDRTQHSADGSAADARRCRRRETRSERRWRWTCRNMVLHARRRIASDCALERRRRKPGGTGPNGTPNSGENADVADRVVTLGRLAPADHEPLPAPNAQIRIRPTTAERSRPTAQDAVGRSRQRALHGASHASRWTCRRTATALDARTGFQADEEVDDAMDLIRHRTSPWRQFLAGRFSKQEARRAPRL